MCNNKECNNKRYFYGRVSAKDQNLARQIELSNGCDEVITDKESGKDFERTGYKKLIEKIKPGDTIVIKSLDRFGRNYDLIINEWRRLRELGVKIEVLDMPILNSREDSLTDKLISDIVLQLLSYVAESERNNIRERQAEGIRIAKEKGVKFGKDSFKGEINKPDNESVIAYCKRVGISRSTYYKYC